jgi:hypothetical protein
MARSNAPPKMLGDDVIKNEADPRGRSRVPKYKVLYCTGPSRAPQFMTAAQKAVTGTRLRFFPKRQRYNQITEVATQ